MSERTPRLEAVLFDVDDTLYSTTAFSTAAWSAAVDAMIAHGLRVDHATGVRELAEIVDEFSSNYPGHFARLLDRLGPGALAGRNPAVLIAAGVVAYHDAKDDGIRLLPDVGEVLERLHHAGVRLGVISAGLQVKQGEKLVRLGVLGYFDPAAIFFTDQMGIGKPNPKIYAAACALMGVAPARAMYVGDRLDHDVLPARAAGMRTTQYTGAGGKHGRRTGPGEPDHRLEDLRDLLPILREAYGLPV